MIKLIKNAFDKTIIKNSILICSGNVSSQLLAFLIFIVMAWIYETSEYGYIRWAIQIGTFLSVICSFGIPSALTRYVAEEKSKEENIVDIYFSNVILIITVGTLILFVAAIAVFHNFHIWLVCVSLTIPTVYYGFVRGLMDVTKITLLNVIKNLIKLFMILFALIIPFLRSIDYAIVAYLVGGIASVILMEIIKSTNIKIKKKYLSTEIIKKLIRFSLFAFIGTIGYSLIPTVCYLVLESRDEYESIAFFSASSTILTVITFIPNSIHTVVMPKIAEDKNNRIVYFKQTIILTLLASIPLSLVLIIFGKEIIILLFGPTYINSYEHMLWMSAGFIFANIRNAFTTLWEGLNIPEITSIDVIIGSAVSGISAIVLASKVGSAGVGGGFTLGFLSATIINILFYIIYRKNLYKGWR